MAVSSLSLKSCVAEDFGEDTIILKKINLRALLEDAIDKAKSVDLDKLERDIEEESNQLACYDNHFDKIKRAELIEVCSNTK
ncbi:MAG: hypothetical protein ABR985_17105 [Methanotrichaceae archaeon]